MQLILKIVLPLVLYIIYCIIDVSHTIFIHRPPAANPADLDIYRQIEATLDYLAIDGPPIDSESTEVVRVTKNIAQRIMYHLWFLFDWHTPAIFNKFFPYDFHPDFADGRSDPIGRGSRIAGALTMILFTFGLAFWIPVQWKDTYVGFLLSASSGIVITILLYKYVGRYAYWLILIGLQALIKIFVKIFSGFSETVSDIKMYFKKDDDDLVTAARKAQFVFLDDPHAEGYMRNKQSQAFLEMAQQMDTKFPVSGYWEDVKSSFEELYGNRATQLLKKILLPPNGIQYDFKTSPVSSVIRWWLFEQKSTYLGVALFIVTYIVGGGYGMSTYMLTNHQDDDEEENQEESKTGTLDIITGLIMAAAISCIYCITYCSLLSGLRQFAINFLISKKGIKKKEAWLIREVLLYDHKYPAPGSNGDILPKLKPLQDFKDSFVQFAFYSIMISLIAFILVGTYVALFNPKDRSPDDDNQFKLEHYIEAMKTIAVLLAIILVLKLLIPWNLVVNSKVVMQNMSK